MPYVSDTKSIKFMDVTSLAPNFSDIKAHCDQNVFASEVWNREKSSFLYTVWEGYGSKNKMSTVLIDT